MLFDLKKLSVEVEKSKILRDVVRTSESTIVRYKKSEYPLFNFTLGTTLPEAPVLFITGGVHGLERIGAQLAWSFLKTTIDRLKWDHTLQNLLQTVRIVVVPLVNPVGFYHYKRSNGNDVDLMRNSPINAIDKTPFLLGGHRFSRKLPWYRGAADELEVENQALKNLFDEQVIQSRCAVAIDFHSGFGMKDRLWFPFSYSKTPFDFLPETVALTELFEQSYPYHIYQIEPQSKGYLLNGDLWDYLFLEFRKKNKTGVFIPFTLEMGSWNWVRKNPLQLFSRQGVFNPVKEHRLKRTYRRHHLFLDFVQRALYSNSAWAQHDQTAREAEFKVGIKRWYE